VTIPDEVTLVRRSLRGDADAIANLVERFQGEVFGLCMRLLHQRQDAEDVTQEVFLRIFRSLGGWDSSRPLRPWIMSIAVNRCRTWLTQRARRPELADYLQDTAESKPPDDSAELLGEIRTALAALRVEYRTAFVLFHEQGHPYEDIARVMDRPIGTIKTWLHRARLEILDRLRQRGMLGDETPTRLFGSQEG